MNTVANYRKGILSAIGAAATLTMELGTDLCGSVWPGVAAVLTTILVVVVPNTKE